MSLLGTITVIPIGRLPISKFIISKLKIRWRYPWYSIEWHDLFLLRYFQVQIGFRRYDIGYVQFAERNLERMIVLIGGSCLGAILILVVILITVWFKKTRRGCFHKKVPDIPNVRYRSGNAVQFGNPNDQIYRMPVENRK